MTFRYLLILTFFLFSFLAQGQKLSMSLNTYDDWKTISGVELSKDGAWTVYNLSCEDCDKTLVLHNNISGQSKQFNRASNATFNDAATILAFMVKAPVDTIKQLKRLKTKEDKMPKDTLIIYSLLTEKTDTFARVSSYKLPEKGGDFVSIHFEAQVGKDSTLLKKESKKNGSLLSVFDFQKDSLVQFYFVKNYLWSEKTNRLLIHSVGQDSINRDSLLIHDALTHTTQTIHKGAKNYAHFNWNDQGTQLVFLTVNSDKDSTDGVWLWNSVAEKAETVVDKNIDWLDENYVLSPYFKPLFSENGNRLYYGISAALPPEDTTLLDSEKVDLEIWNHLDDYLYPEQKMNLKSDKEQSFPVMYLLDAKTHMVLTDASSPNYYLSEKLNSDYFLSTNTSNYGRFTSWENNVYRDLYLTNLKTGDKKMIAEKMEGYARTSPSEKYVYWFNKVDTSWMAYDIFTNSLIKLTSSQFYDETNDRPMHPDASGLFGWTKDDNHMLIYDEYDIWKINMKTLAKTRLTRGREERVQFRYISLEDDIESLPVDTSILIRLFDEKDKSSGYAYLNIENGGLRIIEKSAFNYSRRIYKAENSSTLIFTKESFDLFPDLILTDTSFSNQRTISYANPQQNNYLWGSIELFKWTDYDGNLREGLLVKPENFDPDKKYPLIVNFYERSSDRLHDHREPYPHRSTINYTYWTNKGYVIFNPDVHYIVGAPGKSCYNAVVSGTEALLKEGFIDEKRMGLQGHSWGGYQIADLLTRTHMFACAESGAPVVNMTSAYGGIRWGSGRSRMFQYEQTQSRLGKTLWEDREVYLENSPLFNLDKVTTPVLILHNDQDGAVPWYQGIEFFVAMRRLGKPAWMLNYVNEPHWPLKRQNRLDFNHRMEQFFDHYLMDQPMPDWMSKGVPALYQKTDDGFGFSK